MQPSTPPDPFAPAGRPGPRCPTCGEPVVREGNLNRPFCSVTCRLIDLGVWLDEGYRIERGENEDVS